MKKTLDEIEKRFAEIDAAETEPPTAEDIAAFEAAEAESEEESVTLEEYKSQKEYSGNLTIRIPKELHKALAQSAKENGVSLNQYALYKLAK